MKKFFDEKNFLRKQFFEKNLRILKIRFVIQCLKEEINRCVRYESVHDHNDYLLHSIFLANFGGFTEMVTDIQTEGQMDGCADRDASKKNFYSNIQLMLLKAMLMT